jgi:hypothetical protein
LQGGGGGAINRCMQRPTAPRHIALIVCLASSMAACPEDDACLTECKPDSATTDNTSTSGGSSTPPTTSASSTGPSQSTGATTTASTSSSGGAGGSGESSAGPWQGGHCAGFGPGSCVLFGFGFCTDIDALCMSANVNAETCSAVASACANDAATPCRLCTSMWDSCVAAAGDVLSPKCETLGETCGCLVSSHF